MKRSSRNAAHTAIQRRVLGFGIVRRMMCKTRVYMYLLLCWCIAAQFCSCQRVAGGTSSDKLNNGRDIRYACPQFGPSFSCGEGWCQCFDEGLANCSGLASQGRSLRFVPKLPPDIRTLCFGDDDVTSVATADFFANVTQIQKLYLGFDGLTFLHPDAFRSLANLTALSLEGNSHLREADLSVVFAIPTLQQLDLRLCELGPDPGPTFRDVSTPGLRVLFLGENRFETIDFSAFSSLTALETLYLDRNRILRVHTSSVVSSLRKVHMSQNSIYDFPKTCDITGASFFPELEFLDLSQNNIASLPRRVCLPKLQTLNLGGNNFDILESGSFTGDVFPALRELHLDSMKPGLTLKGGAFRGLTNLQLVNLSEDDLIVMAMVLEAFVDCPRVTTLELNLNTFCCFEGSVRSQSQEPLSSDAGFTGERSSQSSFDGAELKDNTYHSVGSTASSQSQHDLRFSSEDRRRPQRPLEGVQRLGLFSSGLEDSFDLAQLVAYFPKLTELFLSSNLLTRLPDGVFDSLRDLQHVYLSQNKIQVISESTFSLATRRRLVTLDLSNNPFRCSCELLWFLSWVKTSPSHFFPKVSYNCDDEDGQKLVDFVLDSQSCLLSHGVYESMVYVISLSLLVFVIVVLVFRYRWHLRLVLYEVFRGPGDVRLRHLETGDFDYDVFVSHDSDDEPWVRQHLMPQVEERLGLRLCLHQRDFIPGKDIVSNIVTCVQSSKKVMMLFSPSFAKSPWCQFELTFCLQHVMDLDDALVILCLGDVASRDLTAAMMAVLKTTTCLQWVGEGRGKEAEESFWGRVRIALKEITPCENV